MARMNPIEGGIEQAIVEIRSSLELILSAGVGAELYADAADACLAGRNPAALEQQVLRSLDDAISNNWDELIAAFWRGVAADVIENEEAAEVPGYIWPAPKGDGWIDAWNGWYPTLDQAKEDAAAGIDQPWILHPGEDLIDEAEVERRRAVQG